MLATTIPKTVEEIGAIAGIVSFVLMLALLVLYVIRAMELRKLRKTMPFLVNPQNGKPDDAASRRGRQGID
ncbi:MAG TPA: hypothetical protein VHR38_02390 [Solirubrobacterales bacterium]|jgi:hypothetical protein|nr:hypothetical protein [Solirubrobacterales bacterium]